MSNPAHQRLAGLARVLIAEPPLRLAEVASATRRLLGALAEDHPTGNPFDDLRCWVHLLAGCVDRLACEWGLQHPPGADRIPEGEGPPSPAALAGQLDRLRDRCVDAAPHIAGVFTGGEVQATVEAIYLAARRAVEALCARNPGAAADALLDSPPSDLRRLRDLARALGACGVDGPPSTATPAAARGSAAGRDGPRPPGLLDAPRQAGAGVTGDCGPIPPNRFRWGKLEAVLADLRWKLMQALCPRGQIAADGVPEGELAEAVYDGEKPPRNPIRALQDLQRHTQSDLYEAGIPLVIACRNRRYFLDPSGPVAP